MAWAKHRLEPKWLRNVAIAVFHCCECLCSLFCICVCPVFMSCFVLCFCSLICSRVCSLFCFCACFCFCRCVRFCFRFCWRFPLQGHSGKHGRAIRKSTARHPPRGRSWLTLSQCCASCAMLCLLCCALCAVPCYAMPCCAVRSRTQTPGQTDRPTNPQSAMTAFEKRIEKLSVLVKGYG